MVPSSNTILIFEDHGHVRDAKYAIISRYTGFDADMLKLELMLRN